jgi:hypothetical protein
VDLRTKPKRAHKKSQSAKGHADEAGDPPGEQDGGRNAPILCQLPHEHLVELSLEHTVCAKLPLLAHLSGHLEAAIKRQKRKQSPSHVS